jgi:PiT family inorganic phosphate transporter
VVPTVLSPVVGLLTAWLLCSGAARCCGGVNRRLTLRRLRMAQSVSAAAVALGHGLQDGQKTMGAVVLALTAAGQQSDGSVPAVGAAAGRRALAAGTAAGGWRLIRTLGRRVAPLDALGGFAAQSSSAVVLYLAAAVGAPISSTQTVTASVAGPVPRPASGWCAGACSGGSC